jgi:hypothetical protein
MNPEDTNTTGSTTAASTAKSSCTGSNSDNDIIHTIPPSSSSSTSDDSDDTLLCLNFNQDGGCLAVGTAHGFRICNTLPFLETFRRNFHNPMNGNTINNEQRSNHQVESDNTKDVGVGGGGGGGIGKIEMLFRCNLLALVGGGNSPQYQKNKVLIWDDHLGRPIGELSFRQRVLSVKLRRDRICVVLKDRIYVYNFSNLALLDTIVTGPNPLGLLCISTDAGSTASIGSIGGNGKSGADNKDDIGTGMVLACPSVTCGQARVELYGKRKTLLIDAHENELAAMALSVDGYYLATASLKGTIVRLFSTLDKGHDSSIGVPLREFRRGVEQAVISSLSFSLDKCWLACASDHGTVHVFKVEDEENMESLSNRKNQSNGSSHNKKGKSSSSSLSSKLAKKILPTRMFSMSPRKLLLEGENSYVQVRGITHPMTCAFVPDKPRTLAVAGLDEAGNGCLLLASFGPIGCSADTAKTDDSHTNDHHTQSSTSKGEAQRLAYHRFFKKGHSKVKNNYYGENDMNERQLKFKDVENEISRTNDIEEITFGDDAEDGFINVTADQKVSHSLENKIDQVHASEKDNNNKEECVDSDADDEQKPCNGNNSVDDSEIPTATTETTSQ